MKQLVILLILYIYIFNFSYCPYPIALFHGIGDGCDYKNTSKLVSNLAKDLDTHVECIEIGNGFLTSWFKNFTLQAEEACEKIKSNPNFQEKFSIIGISQGTLLGRYVIEACGMKGKVVNYLSFDGPQMGIASLPKFNCGTFCEWLNTLTSKVIYSDIIVSNLGPASYYKYKGDYSLFYKKNKFLKDLNNEGEVKNEEYKKRFGSLEKVMLIKGAIDTVITPRESSWFEIWDEKGKEIVQLEDSKFYKEDFIGLRKLDEEGKVEFVLFEGEHVMYTPEEYEIIRDFFK